jgi:hypothetical protein
MNYLAPSEYEDYALEAITPAAWIGAASGIIDGYCRRPTLAIAVPGETAAGCWAKQHEVDLPTARGAAAGILCVARATGSLRYATTWGLAVG